jgi:small subunit ribosomal protein S6e
MAQVYYIVSDPKVGKSYQKVTEESYFQGKKIGETVQGGQLGLAGYELKITGGTDFAGIPMLKNIEGQARKILLLTKGPAVRSTPKKGQRVRRTINGNTISPTTAQVNLKVTKYGTKPIPESLGIQPKEEAKPAEPAAETKKA